MFNKFEVARLALGGEVGGEGIERKQGRRNISLVYSSSSTTTCVNVPSALMLAMDPPSC
jgi:hypothetical protein